MWNCCFLVVSGGYAGSLQPSSGGYPAYSFAAITVAELRYGIASMPDGKRRSGLSDVFEQQVLPLFANRVLSFSLNSTTHYAQLMAAARSSGLSVSSSDGMIALANNMSVATRDTAPFEAAQVRVINPWDV